MRCCHEQGGDEFGAAPGRLLHARQGVLGDDSSHRGRHARGLLRDQQHRCSLFQQVPQHFPT
ncbi:unnamed protein product, partial [Ixodes pacificus]